MATDAKTLDALLRARAAGELRSELEVAARPLYDLLQRTHTSIYLQMGVVGPDGKPKLDQTYAAQVIKQITTRLYEMLLPERGDAEVAAFLKRVDQLQDEINDLRDSVGN